MLKPLDLRNVRMAVHDRRAIREARGQAGLTPNPRPWDVDHANARRPDLDDAFVRQRLLENLLVHVPVNALDGRAQCA